MGAYIDYFGGGGGSKISNANIIDYIGTDENIDKGKFFEFLSNFGSSKVTVTSGATYNYTLHCLIELSEEKYVLYYRVQNGSSSYSNYGVVISVSDKTVTIGTPTLANGTKAVKIDDTHIMAVYTLVSLSPIIIAAPHASSCSAVHGFVGWMNML